MMTQRRLTARLLILFGVTMAGGAGATSLAAQGCEPIRFTTPVNLGGQGKVYQPGHEWEMALSWRHLNSDDFYVGNTKLNGLAPIFDINTFVGSVSYAATDRIRVMVSVPFQLASLVKGFPDGQGHEQTTKGIGDISAMAETWLLDPRTNESGNVSISLGFKAPTGSHTQMSTFYTATGPVPFPADQTIQNGDGGWAIMTGAQAFRQVLPHTYAYLGGSYMISPKAASDVNIAPDVKLPWAVPDVYSMRAGGVYAVMPGRLTLSLGARFDGTPQRDLLGGGDATTVKRPFFLVYTEPGLSVTNGHGTLSISAPIRTAVRREPNLFEKGINASGGGGFAKFLVFASYSYRL